MSRNFALVVAAAIACGGCNVHAFRDTNADSITVLENTVIARREGVRIVMTKTQFRRWLNQQTGEIIAHDDLSDAIDHCRRPVIELLFADRAYKKAFLGARLLTGA